MAPSDAAEDLRRDLYFNYNEFIKMLENEENYDV